MENNIKHVIGLRQLNLSNLALVGGKNASLGEMIKNLTKLHLKVPDGFATTAAAYQEFLEFIAAVTLFYLLVPNIIYSTFIF